MAEVQFELHENEPLRFPRFSMISSRYRLQLILAVLLFILLVIALVFIALYAKEQAKDGDGKRSSQAAEFHRNETWNTTKDEDVDRARTCLEPSCIRSAAEIIQKRDTSVKPCDDFYKYSCGSFVKNTHVPDQQDDINMFTQTSDTLKHEIRALLEDVKLKKKYSKNPNSTVSKAFDYYYSCMNTTAIDEAGTAVLWQIFEDYGSCVLLKQLWNQSAWSLERALGQARRDFGLNLFVKMAVQPSLFNNSQTRINIGVGRTKYAEISEDLHSDKKTPRQKAYLTFIHKAFYHQKASQTLQLVYLNAMIKFESDFDNLTKNFDLRDAATTKGYAKIVKEMTIAELKTLTHGKFNWKVYINEILSVAGKFVDDDSLVLVFLPDDLTKVIDFLDSSSKFTLANEVIWHVFWKSMFALPQNFREAEIEYNLAALGKVEPRWRSCVTGTNKYFKYATALLYVQRHFPDEIRQRAIQMFKEIRTQFNLGLNEQKWMDDATREQARIKLFAMKQDMGYPDFIKDPLKLNKVHETLDINPLSLYQNFLNIKKQTIRKDVEALGKPANITFPAAPLLVNGLFFPQMNKMIVLLGMLKTPNFESQKLKAFGYAGVGHVIGHEITHGFDVLGGQFDERGILRNWFSEESSKNYKIRSRCIAEQYNNTYIYGVKLNGMKTLAENIADNGGVRYAYRAYKAWRQVFGEEAKLPGLDYDNDQLFFVAYAQKWCTKLRPELVAGLVEISPHSFKPARAAIPLYNMPEFNKAFNCKPRNVTCAVW